MKKIIFSMLALSLMALCFSGNVNAQSSEKDLDQRELMKQFTGSWVTERAEDSTIVWDMIPFGKGYEHILSWQAKGETYLSAKGITRVGTNLIEIYWLWSNGNLARDFGKFESDNEIVFERYNRKHIRVYATLGWNLVNPDKIKMTYKWRGSNETWDDAEVTEWIWTKIKK